MAEVTAELVWLIVIAVVVVGVAPAWCWPFPAGAGWRREKLRPKGQRGVGASQVLATHPRNLVEIFGGNIVAQLFVALALGAALHAFGDHLGLATLLVVLTLGSMLGGVSPVPGGMGVVEAGMIIGLTAAGISQTDAVAAVFVQRCSPPTSPRSGAGSCWCGCGRRSTLTAVATTRNGCRPDGRWAAFRLDRGSGKDRSRPIGPSRSTLTPTSAAGNMARSPRLLP